MAIEWISEGDELPIVAQAVLLATPRQFGEWWDVRVRCILIRHEAVCPLPIKPGSKWPTDYYWGDPRDPQVGTSLVTGNSWWAHFDQIPLPPNAEHYVGRRRGERLIKQIGDVWIGKSKSHKGVNVMRELEECILRGDEIRKLRARAVNVADRKYQTVHEAKWDVSADDLVQIHLTLALSKHIPGWPGATDDQLWEVAKEIVTALDETPRAETK